MDLMSLPLWLQLLALMLTNVPPGESHLSVEVMPECGSSRDAPTCDVEARVCDGRDPNRHGVLCGPPFWSDWYEGWVRYERSSTAAERYIVLAQSMSRVAHELLCVEGDGVTVAEECTPIPWGYDRRAKRNRGTPRSLSISALAASLQESGFREDVRMGRGMARAGRSVDGGTGQGRGPGGEIGEMQVMPKMACRFGAWLSSNERKRCLDEPAYREQVAMEMLGSSRGAVERALSVGMRMLAHSREHCRRTKRIDGDKTVFGSWYWAMYAYYGTGTSCLSSNVGQRTERDPHPKSKTLARAAMFDRFWNTPRVASWVWAYFERRGLGAGVDAVALNP